MSVTHSIWVERFSSSFQPKGTSVTQGLAFELCPRHILWVLRIRAKSFGLRILDHGFKYPLGRNLFQFIVDLVVLTSVIPNSQQFKSLHQTSCNYNELMLNYSNMNGLEPEFSLLIHTITNDTFTIILLSNPNNYALVC